MRRRWWAVVIGLAAIGLAVSVFNGGPWLEAQRDWASAHHFDNGLPLAGLTDGDWVAMVIFSSLFALVGSVPALGITGWLAHRAGRSAPEVILTATLSWPVFAVLGGRAEAALATVVGLGADQRVADILTPPVEELLLVLCASAVLLAWPPRGLRTGIVLGLAAGIGMNVFETALYVQQGGVGSWMDVPFEGQWSVVAARGGLFGFGLHAVTAALSMLGVAAFLARPSGARRYAPAIAAIAASIAIHAIWNATATTVVNWLARAIGGPDAMHTPAIAFLSSSTVALLYLGIPMLVLVTAWRRAGLPAARLPAAVAEVSTVPLAGVASD